MLADRLANKIAVGWYLAPYECRGAGIVTFVITIVKLRNKLSRKSLFKCLTSFIPE